MAPSEKEGIAQLPIGVIFGRCVERYAGRTQPVPARLPWVRRVVFWTGAPLCAVESVRWSTRKRCPSTSSFVATIGDLGAA